MESAKYDCNEGVLELKENGIIEWRPSWNFASRLISAHYAHRVDYAPQIRVGMGSLQDPTCWDGSGNYFFITPEPLKYASAISFFPAKGFGESRLQQIAIYSTGRSYIYGISKLFPQYPDVFKVGDRLLNLCRNSYLRFNTEENTGLFAGENSFLMQLKWEDLSEFHGEDFRLTLICGKDTYKAVVKDDTARMEEGDINKMIHLLELLWL